MTLLTEASGVIKRTDVLIAREKKNGTVQVTYKFADIFVRTLISKQDYGKRDPYSLALLLSSKLQQHFNSFM